MQEQICGLVAAKATLQRFARDAAVRDLDSFGAQPPRLFAIRAGAAREHDPAAGSDDAVPWQMEAGGQVLQRIPGLARAAGQTGSAGDVAVGRNGAARNLRHRVPDGLNRRVIVDRLRAAARRRPAARKQQRSGSCVFCAPRRRSQFSRRSVAAAAARSAAFTRLRNASLATMACTSAASVVPRVPASRTMLRTTG